MRVTFGKFPFVLLRLIFFLIPCIFFWDSTEAFEPDDFHWPGSKLLINIPVEFNTSEAIYITDSSEVKIIVNRPERTIFTSYFRYRKVKILSEASLDKYGNLYIPDIEGMKTLVMKTRILKPDGTIIEFSRKDMERSEVAGRIDWVPGVKISMIPVPGVEVGDVLETAYSIHVESLPISSYYFFHTEIPVLNAHYKLIVSRGIEISYANYNGLSKPNIEYNKEYTILSWYLTNLPKILYSVGSIPFIELPVLRFAVRSLNILTPNTSLYFDFSNPFYVLQISGYAWEEYFGALLNSIQTDQDLNSKSEKSLQHFYSKLFEDGERPTKKFIKVHRYLVDSVTLVEQKTKKQKLDKGFSQKRMNRTLVFQAYLDILERSGIRYYIGIAKSKRNGDLDYNFVDANQVDYLLVAFEDQKGNLRYIIP
ncbi:MAG: DUF3857 domain-containing protein, partial [Bacteroidetes bacterium]|nr:DUF3857 domain-containing protein [Bacteroidota bacterium]